MVDVLRADGRRWFPLLRSPSAIPAGGVPVRRLVAPVRGPGGARRAGHARRRATSWRATLDARRGGGGAGRGGRGAAPRGRAPDRGRGCARAVARGTSPTDVARRRRGGPAAARVARSGGARRRVGAVPRADAPRRTWSSGPTWCAARPSRPRRPGRRVLGLAAWQAGQGALAWCAVDRCRRRRPRLPDGPAGRRPAEQAMPPSVVGRSGAACALGLTSRRHPAIQILVSRHGRRGRRTGVHPRRPHPAPREGAALPRRVRADAAGGAPSTPTTR